MYVRKRSQATLEGLERFFSFAASLVCWALGFDTFRRIPPAAGFNFPEKRFFKVHKSGV
jgi:hypothetical protein